ncbi:MAG: riboflavin synthase [Desulfobacteraceae bacterium]|nr:riboflavin synthase [Desulfobacteraceae bacterium]
MFTGIIEGLGTLTGIRPGAQSQCLSITADFILDGTRIGDSIATNGACLTVTGLSERTFTADVSPETLSKTSFISAKVGDRVNLERSMRLSDRLDGHLVSGHIDGVGVLSGRRTKGNAILLTFEAPPDVLRYIIKKGSVAIEGISVTVNVRDERSFEVSVIPHTAKITTIGLLRAGDRVNIETDLIGRYVEHFLTGDSEKPESIKQGVSWQLLAKSGFVK